MEFFLLIRNIQLNMKFYIYVISMFLFLGINTINAGPKFKNKEGAWIMINDRNVLCIEVYREDS